jgi:thiol-disulfide isomerase/thioredoxin
MKRLLLPGLLFLLLCGPVWAQPCQVSGTIAGIGTKPIIFWYTQQGQRHADTVRATNDHFTYLAQPSDDNRISLFISAPRFTYFWYEPGKVLVTGTAAQPSQLAITGTPENNILNQYNQSVEWKFTQLRKEQPTAEASMREQKRQATLQFIKGHLAARTSAYLLYWELINQEHYFADYERIFKQMTPAVQRSAQGQTLAAQLAQVRNQPLVGRPAPAFTLADTAGTPVALTAYRGRYVLLDFWGHWCGPCIKAMPQLKALAEQRAGQLAVIGIGAEDASHTALWKKAVRSHQVPGAQLSELQSDTGPVTRQYNIHAFPTYLLLDRAGIVRVRTNDLGDIERELLTVKDL